MSTKMKTIFTLIACLALLTAAPAQVMINEVHYDTPSTDDTSIMYTEIYGPPGTNLDGWTLVGINGNGGAPYLTLQLEGDIPDDGYFVVGGSNVANVDQVSPHDWQNAGSASGVSCDGLDLRNSTGTTVDHLCYGECDADDICTGEGGTNGPDPFPSGGMLSAIARIPDHQDTDDNGADWQATEDLTPGEPNEGEPCVPVYADLIDIRENDANGVPVMLGTFVIVEGIIIIEDGLLLETPSSLYFQDDDAGANLYGGVMPAGLVVGDCVRVSGWVEQFRGLTEISGSGPGNCIWDCDVIGHTDPPEPVVLQGNSFFESFEGMLVKFEHVTITGGDAWPTEGNDATITVTDGNGTFTLRIDKETGVDGMPEPEEEFDLTGIMTQYDFDSPYDGFYQVIPRYRSDIVPSSAADDPTDLAMPAEFRLDGAFPNPFNSTTNLRFTVGNASELIVHVFDLLGREVATEKLTGLTPGNHVWNWTPAGATGLYIVRVESENVIETAKLLYLK
ncbi:T9SS type A sorting domain-containing protein [bacterium]|nr:T9SS type A sorting domain-containing protein [bacterium]